MDGSPELSDWLDCDRHWVAVLPCSTAGAFNPSSDVPALQRAISDGRNGHVEAKGTDPGFVNTTFPI